MAIATVGGVLAAPVRAADEIEPRQAVIPPGQEELLLTLLGRGASLPAGCELSDGRIEHTVVDATYTCPLGPVDIELSHPAQAPDGAITTQQFALAVESGAPPASLLDAVAASVRAREDDFHWEWVAPAPAPAAPDAGQSGAPDATR